VVTVCRPGPGAEGKDSRRVHWGRPIIKPRSPPAPQETLLRPTGAGIAFAQPAPHNDSPPTEI